MHCRVQSPLGIVIAVAYISVGCGHPSAPDSDVPDLSVPSTSMLDPSSTRSNKDICDEPTTSHSKNVQRFIGTWIVSAAVTTSACQDDLIQELPDLNTVTPFVLTPGLDSDLVSDDGGCSFKWNVEGRELKAEAGQICVRPLSDGGRLNVGLIYANGTLQCDGSTKDSILVTVSLQPKNAPQRTCLVFMQETLYRN
jgi:hypothetical protein